MIDELTDWAISRVAAVDHILRTTDGGVTWNDVTPPETNFVSPPEASWPAASLGDFLDANTAWVIYWAGAVQLNPVWRTRDGGQTWDSSSTIPPLVTANALPTQLTFVDAQTGWLFVVRDPCGTGGCDDHILYSTTDGGHNWEQAGGTYQGGLSDCVKTDLVFVSPHTGWVSGYCEMALVYILQRTDDGGHTWPSQTLPPPPGESNLLEFSQGAGCKASGPAFSSTKAGVLDIYCPSPKDYLVKHWLYVTADRGQTWAPRQAPTDLGTAYFVDADIGWWLSANEPAKPGPSRLYRTSDGGQTWTLIKQLAWSGALDFHSPQVGWAVAHDGDSIALVKTVDGGRTWQELKPHAI